MGTESRSHFLFSSDSMDVLARAFVGVFYANCRGEAAPDVFNALSGRERYGEARDVFLQRHVIVPSQASQSYLSMRLAEGDGAEGAHISANIRFSRGVTRLFDAVLRRAHGVDGEPIRLWKRSILLSGLLSMARGAGEGAHARVGRALARAEQIETAMYANPRFGRGTGELDRLFREIRAHLGAAALAYRLPFEVLGDDALFSRLVFPQSIYWFDPLPMGNFELTLLDKLLRGGAVPPQMVYVFAFNPCESYWEDVKTSVHRPLDGLSWTTQDGEAQREEGFFLLRRCGRISQCLVRNWSALALSADVFVRSMAPACAGNLAALQTDVLEGREGAGRASLPGQKLYDATRDATLQVKGFSDPRQAVAWVAEEICTLFDESASGDTANTWAGLCASDVVVLIPPNLSSDYASFLRAAFLQRNVPFIMQGIAAAHTHVTLDAFALYVAVLGGDDSRQTVLDWLLAPGIIDPDMAPFADACIEIIDALGIYGGTDGTAHAGSYLEGNPAFTWAQGIRRLAMDFAYCTQTLPDVLLPDLNPSLHIQAMAWVSVWRSLFADLQTVRQARLTFAQWRALVMGLFESWLRPEVPYREEDVSTIHAAFDSLWPVDPAGEGDSVHDFGEAEALLKHLVRVVVACGREPALGGIRIRHLHGDVQTARVVFMLGLENENFPSQMPVNSELERFSAYEQDAHAFLKWVLNARDRLYLCGCFLEPEDKQDADAMARDGVLAYEAPYETILAKAAASASVFLRDLMAVTDNLCLGAPLPEPINEERIGVLRGLRQDYHAWTQQNSVSAAAGDTLSASEAPWPGRFDDFPQNIAEALRQAFCSPAARSSHTLPAFSGSNEALPRLPFRALSKFLQQPRDAYRQYILGIPAYQPDGPANLRLKSCEPFEKSGTFTAKQLIPDMMLRLLTSHELSEEKAVEVYETCTCVLRQCGQFPAGVFDEVQRTKDLDWARAILTTLSDLRQTTARRYTFDTRQRTLSRIQQVLQSNLPWGAEPTLLKHEPNLPCQLEGNLPLILDSSDKESIFVFIETAGDEKRIVPQIALATLMLKVSGQTPPNAARFVGKRGSGISLINPHDMFSEEQAAAWLQNLVTLMVTGEHEFSFPRDFNPAKGWQEGFRRAQASSLYRYVGANYLPKQTRAIWRCALQEFQTFFDYLACICPKKQ